MVKTIIRQSFLWIIICGCIAYATMIITGNYVPTFLNARTITIGNYTKTLYTFDIYAYLKQIEDAVLNIPIEKIYIDPPTFPALTNIAVLGKWLVNLLIWIVNMMIWWFNTILFAPTKLLVIQPIVFIATILGIDLETVPIIRIIYALYTTVNVSYIPTI